MKTLGMDLTIAQFTAIGSLMSSAAAYLLRTISLDEIYQRVAAMGSEQSNMTA